MKSVKVSVIIAAFNEERYIGRFKIIDKSINESKRI